MSATNLKSIISLGKAVQTGYGVPTHTSITGFTEYTDLTTGEKYENLTGLPTDWTVMTSESVLDANVSVLTTSLAIPAGTTIPSGTTFSQFVKLLLTQTYYPTITNPYISSYTISPNTAQECGTVTSVVLTTGYNPGNILGKTVNGAWSAGTSQGTRGGAATTYIINGTRVTAPTNSLTITGVTIPLGSLTYGVSTVEYASGTTQPVDSNGTIYLTKLSSGTTAASGTLSVTGYRKCFYGVSASTATDFDTSDQIRSLSNSFLNPSKKSYDTYPTSPSFVITVPAGTMSIAFAYPLYLGTPLSLSIPVTKIKDGSNADTPFNLSTGIFVAGNNGYTPVEYAVYTLTVVEAYTIPTTFSVWL